MKVRFVAEPYGKGIGKGGGGYRGKIVERQERSFDEAIEAASKKTGVTSCMMRSAVTGFLDEMIEDACETARVQKLGDYGKFTINVHGQFRGVNDVYDPGRQTFDMVFECGKKLKKLKPKFTLENRIAPESIEITGIMGDVSAFKQGGSCYMTWGDDTTCNGKNVQMHEGDGVVWSVTIDGREHSGPCEVFRNSAAMLDFRWPEGIPREAIGREILLSFRLRGSRADNAPVEIRRRAKLLE